MWPPKTETKQAHEEEQEQQEEEKEPKECRALNSVYKVVEPFAFIVCRPRFSVVLFLSVFPTFARGHKNSAERMLSLR